MDEWAVAGRVLQTSQRDQAAAWTALRTCTTVQFYTDGSVPVVNPGGPAGFAAIALGWHDAPVAGREDLPEPDARLVLAGFVPARTGPVPTSNNRAELVAVLAALGAAAALEPRRWAIYTDSRYVVRCGRGEYNRHANLDLWDRFDVLWEAERGRIGNACVLDWLKGHAGQRYNEEADDLALRAALEFDDERYAQLKGGAADGHEAEQTDATPPTPETWLAGHQHALIVSAHVRITGEGHFGQGTGRYQWWSADGQQKQASFPLPGSLYALKAEYQTAVAALTASTEELGGHADGPDIGSLAFYSAEQTLVCQLDGTYRVKATELRGPHARVRALLDPFAKVTLECRPQSSIQPLFPQPVARPGRA